jgi:hypothetical protein
MKLAVHLVNPMLPSGPAATARSCPLSAEVPTKRE